MIRKSNPPGLHETPGYHHITVVDVTELKLVFLAGQCPLDAHGELVGPGNLDAQVQQVTRNVGLALSSLGAVPDNVVRTVIYVASTNRADLASVWGTLRESEIADALTSASTLLGVTQLGYPGQLVEIDVTVALSRRE